MSRRKSMQHVVGAVLLLLILVGCSDMTPGQVKGVLESKATGQPTEFTPILFAMTEGMTRAEKAKLEANVLEYETDSSGEFLIKNVLPGRYILMVGFDVLTSIFTVMPGQTVDLGTIEIEPIAVPFLPAGPKLSFAD